MDEIVNLHIFQNAEIEARIINSRISKSQQSQSPTCTQGNEEGRDEGKAEGKDNTEEPVALITQKYPAASSTIKHRPYNIMTKSGKVVNMSMVPGVIQVGTQVNQLSLNPKFGITSKDAPLQPIPQAPNPI